MKDSERAALNHLAEVFARHAANARTQAETVGGIHMTEDSKAVAREVHLQAAHVYQEVKRRSQSHSKMNHSP